MYWGNPSSGQPFVPAPVVTNELGVTDQGYLGGRLYVSQGSVLPASGPDASQRFLLYTYNNEYGGVSSIVFDRYSNTTQQFNPSNSGMVDAQGPFGRSPAPGVLEPPYGRITANNAYGPYTTTWANGGVFGTPAPTVAPINVDRQGPFGQPLNPSLPPIGSLVPQLNNSSTYAPALSVGTPSAPALSVGSPSGTP